ncbi:HEXXH motif domain [Klebsiella pneumoniae]|nr:HEXXH motif domain [Klebsiella pneumoniae]
MKATPPTYDFSRAPSSSGEEGRTIGHPLRMQAGLLGSALKNIETAWPELHAQIEECVRIFGYLPDAAFRSCSAARYSGIVYLGNMDESLLDLEESIVHETGHQVLYQLGEMTRLTLPQTPLEANYVLPWSGSRRDLFGFLHAHYIYALLVKAPSKPGWTGSGRMPGPRVTDPVRLPEGDPHAARRRQPDGTGKNHRRAACRRTRRTGWRNSRTGPARAGESECRSDRLKRMSQPPCGSAATPCISRTAWE